ncbi:MAG: gliding motility-associated C-terminal domain-containing protein, partial [Phaeodactylibacter sp.]|nr:gliding motility-associated C-terminal domain-containing protein [Phaeodactylibacter sp.]
EWLDENNQAIDNQAITQVAQSGVYTLLVTDGTTGCTDSSTVSITADEDLPTASITFDGLLNCQTTALTLDGSSSSSANNNSGFEWLDENQTSLSTDETLVVSNPGFYTLVITDLENGCANTTQVEVTQDLEPPIADAGPDGSLTCTEPTATLDGSNSAGSALSYEWLDASNQLVSSDPLVQVTQPGAYTLLVTDGENGCMASSVVTVSSNATPPTASIALPEILTCQNTPVFLDGTNSTSNSGTITYAWMDASGNLISENGQLSSTMPGMYTLEVTDPENGCSDTAEVEVLQDIEAPIILMDADPSIIDCNTSSVVLDASASSPFGDISFGWSTLDGSILSGEQTPSPEVDQAGTYILTIVNLSNGCTATDSILITENLAAPIAGIETPQTLTCLVTEFQLDASGSSTNGDFAYSWTSTPPGGILSGANTLTPLINASGTYTLTVLNNENGCSAETSIPVDQDIYPPIAIAGVFDQFDCLTESVSLTGEGSSQGPAFTYQWTGNGPIDDGTTLWPTVYQAGAYQLWVTDQSNGCVDSVLLQVEENPNMPVGLEADITAPACSGDLGSLEITFVEGGQAPYSYSIDDGAVFSQTSYFPELESGTYTVLVQDAIGCEYEETLSIPFVNELDINLPTAVTLDLGDSYELNAQINVPINEIDTIIWSPTEGLSCLDCLDPVVGPISEALRYAVTIVTLNGCQISAEISLQLDKTREVFMPNVFSPHNEDGINDVFMIFGNTTKIKAINTFQIFDRWGEMVFEAQHFQAN